MSTNQDYIRVLRLYEFEGTREAVEKQLRESTHDELYIADRGITIKAVTISNFTEVISHAGDKSIIAVLPDKFGVYKPVYDGDTICSPDPKNKGKYIECTVEQLSDKTAYEIHTNHHSEIVKDLKGFFSV